MTYRSEIEGLEAHLARAESERDAWRAAGRQEKYLEAYSMVEALEVQLDQLQSARHSMADALRPASAQSVDCDTRTMAELSIRHNGRNYEYRSYRYDRLADAVSYAKLDRACKLEEHALADATLFKAPPPPSDAEREEMRRLAITVQDGVYCLRDYRYDRLADAVAYAKLTAI
jgi:hypothetical protein